MGSALRLALPIALLLVASNARAGEDARDLSKQGYELFLANRCAEAIPILERSEKLAPDPRTLVNLARCEDKMGRLIAAREHLVAARDLARDRLVPEMVAQLETMIAETEKRIPHVTVSIDPSAPPATIVRHGETELPRATLERVALDPGEQSLLVSAAGYETKTFTVTLAESETRTLVVAPGASLSRAPVSTKVSPLPLKTIGIAAMAVGAAGLVLGGVFGVIAIGKKSDAGCKDEVCPDDKAGRLRDDAKSAGNISTIAFVAGGVLGAGGLGLFLFAPSVGPDHVGATMSGRF